jgi:hypothetical protein
LRVSKPPALRPPLPALVVPADPDEPTRRIDLNDGDHVTILRREVGGPFDVQAHAEAELWLHDEGRIIGLPINVRVNHWTLNESTRAKEGTIGEPQIIYGDVLVAGPADEQGEITPLDDRLASYFENLQLNKNALSDWDIRNTEWTITVFDAWDPKDFDPGL